MAAQPHKKSSPSKSKYYGGGYLPSLTSSLHAVHAGVVVVVIANAQIRTVFPFLATNFSKTLRLRRRHKQKQADSSTSSKHRWTKFPHLLFSPPVPFYLTAPQRRVAAEWKWQTLENGDLLYGKVALIRDRLRFASVMHCISFLLPCRRQTKVYGL